MAKEIHINQKQGFCCGNDGCTLYDERGPFLQYAKSINFNLPPGKYVIKHGMVSALPSPVIYQLPKLPQAEKKLALEGMKITEHRTHQVKKAGIDVSQGDYYINPDWEKTLTTPELVFCQNHEVGHFFYFSQDKCDMWAEYNMLDMGFNPTQIALASHSTLCGMCSNPGPLEKMLNLEIPYESAMRRMGTESRMLDTSLISGMLHKLQNLQNDIMPMGNDE